MKPPHAFGSLPHIRCRPDCGGRLVESHPVWRKPIQSLAGTEHVTSLGFRCTNPSCPLPRTVYRSARAEARQVKGSGYGLDVVAHIGQLRFGQHRTRQEIWRQLDEQTPVQISERHVQNLLEVYLALLRASHGELQERLAPVVAEHGGLIVALDGLQPEQGNEQLWVVREVLSGAALAAANLPEVSAPFLEPLLQPIRATGLPVLGVVSDAQQSIRVAVATVFPSVPHQLCQYHALKEAAEPLWEADRHLLVESKQELRPLRDVEERTRQPEAPAPTGAAVRARVEAGLEEVTTACRTGAVAAWLRPKLEHLVTVLRWLGGGLYHCYDVPALPRTDNDLEQFYRRLKAQQRRITGHRRSDHFVVRVGGFAA